MGSEAEASLTMWSPAFVAAQRAYSVALRTRYGRGGMRRVHDESVRIDPRVRHLVPHASEEALYRFLQREVAPGAVVLDVGSFLGIYASSKRDSPVLPDV